MAGGGDVYASEEDPELLMAALPFGLKTMEGLITSSPGNTNLRLAAGRGFAAYAYLVQQSQGGGRSATTAERRALDHRVSRLFHAGATMRWPGWRRATRASRRR